MGVKPNENHVFLGDFGMVTKYKTDNLVPSKKYANNGTLEYIALDGHIGSEFHLKLIFLNCYVDKLKFLLHNVNVLTYLFCSAYSPC